VHRALIWKHGKNRKRKRQQGGNMIVPEYQTHGLRPATQTRKLKDEVELFGKARIGPDAAREIARRIEEEHGFWDHPNWRAA
jgi:hypothetical protein